MLVNGELLPTGVSDTLHALNGKKEKPPAIVMTDGKREIIRKLLSEYYIQTAQDIQEALKDLLGGTLKGECGKCL